MIHKKIIYLLISLLLTVSCKTSFTHKKKYKPTKNKFIFKDSNGTLFLGVPLYVIDVNVEEKSKKLYFTNDIFLSDDRLIASIDTILDLETFSKYEGTDIYYFDKNRVYSYGNDPARFPFFNEINLNVKEAVIVDSLLIKENKKEYYKGVLSY